jgi:hypothetical protein
MEGHLLLIKTNSFHRVTFGPRDFWLIRTPYTPTHTPTTTRCTPPKSPASEGVNALRLLRQSR